MSAKRVSSDMGIEELASVYAKVFSDISDDTPDESSKTNDSVCVNENDRSIDSGKLLVSTFIVCTNTHVSAFRIYKYCFETDKFNFCATNYFQETHPFHRMKS
jgi:hypothetical protein